MTWYDKNSLQDRVALGGQLAVMIGVCWFCFAVGTWLVIYFFWNESGPLRDGTWLDRWLYSAGAGVFGIIPAYLLGLISGGRDFTQQNAAIEAQEAEERAAVVIKKTAHLAPVRRPGFSGLTLGTSTGFLEGRGHYAGMPAGTTLHLSAADVCKNIWIGGGIGGGKTTRLINPILQQVLAQDVSALIFDMKGDFRREVDYIAGRVGRTYKVVGDGGMTLNLFRGCTPEVASSYLKSCFVASGSANGDGAFFAETATNYSRNLLLLIQLAKLDYSIAGLSALAFSPAMQMEALAAARARELAGDLDDREKRYWPIVLSYMTDTVGNWDVKFRGNITGTMEAVLNPFVAPDLVDAFSLASDRGEADLYDLLNSAEVFLVNLPRHKFGAAGARFAYLLIKLRFMTMMSERRAKPELNQDRYVCYMADEYQVIVDSLADVDFWDKSRSSKCFGVVSMQGYSSLVQAVGNPQAAAAIYQNWRQRVVFRTEDAATIELMGRVLGQVDVHVTSVSEGSSTSVSGQPGSWSAEGAQASVYPATTTVSQSTSYGESTGIQRQGLFEANDWRKLDADYAIFAGNVGDKACDDVIEVAPLYVPEV